VRGHPLPEALEELVMSCLEKAPVKRPGTAVELWRRLGEVSFDEPWTTERAEGWWQANLPDCSGVDGADESSAEIALDPID
jgi:hypothetical protein